MEKNQGKIEKHAMESGREREIGLRKRKKVIHSVLVDLINIELHFG